MLLHRRKPYRHKRLTLALLSAWLLLCIGMLLHRRITRGPPRPGTLKHHLEPQRDAH